MEDSKGDPVFGVTATFPGDPAHPSGGALGPPERIYTRSPFVYRFMDPPPDYATQPKVKVRLIHSVHRGQTAWHASALWNDGQTMALPASEAAWLVAEGAAVEA